MHHVFPLVNLFQHRRMILRCMTDLECDILRCLSVEQSMQRQGERVEVVYQEILLICILRIIAMTHI